jgi:hypothetical protein
MSKKDFIALADDIKRSNQYGVAFTPAHIEVLADFCKGQNGNFNRERWLDYIAGKCGPSGGAVKAA